MGKPEGKRPLGRPIPKWEDDVTSSGLSDSRNRRHGLDCSGSGQEQVAGSCKCGNEPSGSIQCAK